jgi:hypothetical protein
MIAGLMAGTLRKPAGMARYYLFDFSAFAEVRAGETLSTPAITSTPTGLIVGSPTVSGSQVQVLVSGGTAGTRYTLTVTVNTSGGAVLTFDGGLLVT